MFLRVMTLSRCLPVSLFYKIITKRKIELRNVNAKANLLAEVVIIVAGCHHFGRKSVVEKVSFSNEPHPIVCLWENNNKHVHGRSWFRLCSFKYIKLSSPFLKPFSFYFSIFLWQSCFTRLLLWLSCKLRPSSHPLPNTTLVQLSHVVCTVPSRVKGLYVPGAVL